MTKTYIQLGNDTVDATNMNKPEGRVFREAWQLEGEIITVNMTRARNVLRDKLRQERFTMLEALDADFMKALENGQATSDIATKKQKLRDLPSDSRIDDAATPDDLEKLTLAYLMND